MLQTVSRTSRVPARGRSTRVDCNFTSLPAPAKFPFRSYTFGGGMKTAQADFRFPVLGFTTDSDVWGLPDLDALTTCGPRTLTEGLQVGVELVDAEGRRWIVSSVLRTGRAGSLLSRLMPGPAQFRIVHELELLAPLSLADVQA